MLCGEHPPSLNPLHMFTATSTKVMKSKTGTPMLMVSAEAEDPKAKALGITGTLVGQVGFLRFDSEANAQAAHDKIVTDGLLSKIQLKPNADPTISLCDVVFI